MWDDMVEMNVTILHAASTHAADLVFPLEHTELHWPQDVA
jgi:hypothetical protein